MEPTSASRSSVAGGRLLRRMTAVWLATLGVLLVVFAVVVSTDVPILRHPQPELESGSLAAAVLGAALLVVDALVPVPASVVMVALGATAGVAAGVVVSVIGSLGALAIGVWLGRRGRRPLSRLLGPDGEGLGPMVDRYAVAAVIVSRPVPLVAESVALMAGAAGMAWPRVLAAGVAGILPMAVLYAVAGARGSQLSGLVVAGILMALGALSLALPSVTRRLRPTKPL